MNNSQDKFENINNKKIYLCKKLHKMNVYNPTEIPKCYLDKYGMKGVILCSNCNVPTYDFKNKFYCCEKCLTSYCYCCIDNKTCAHVMKKVNKNDNKNKEIKKDTIVKDVKNENKNATEIKDNKTDTAIKDNKKDTVIKDIKNGISTFKIFIGIKYIIAKRDNTITNNLFCG